MGGNTDCQPPGQSKLAIIFAQGKTDGILHGKTYLLGVGQPDSGPDIDRIVAQLYFLIAPFRTSGPAQGGDSRNMGHGDPHRPVFKPG